VAFHSKAEEKKTEQLKQSNRKPSLSVLQKEQSKQSS